MRWLAGALLAALLLLQYRLWVSSDGVRAVVRLEGAVAAGRLQNHALAERNRQLAAEVHDLKQGYAALEERARSDLGMIGPNETFFQVVPRSSAARPAAVAGAPLASAAPLAPRAPLALKAAPAPRAHGLAQAPP
jgi:cell division protein FtsB